jgi:hypothetical protein
MWKGEDEKEGKKEEKGSWWKTRINISEEASQRWEKVKEI